jgi:hypothetical protein
VRYALPDAWGVVVEEALFSAADGAWQLVQYKTC